MYEWKKTNGLIVYIKFDGEDAVWDETVIIENRKYRQFPKGVSLLKDKLNTFSPVIPMTFRYLLACREFDMVGVLSPNVKEEEILTTINEYVTNYSISILKINVGYGEVSYPTNVPYEKAVHVMYGKKLIEVIKY